jgi:hypothetical protein
MERLRVNAARVASSIVASSIAGRRGACAR